MGIEIEGSTSRTQGALVTPSASPPSRSFFPEPYRIPDQPSPTKRPRLASTPKPNTRDNGTPNSSTISDPFDFQQAREDSTMRLLNIWSSLERYVKPLDEDDIVDISTGKLIKDRGVLRKSQRMDVGCFANKMGIVEQGDDGGDEDEDDEDVDELDTFAGEDDVQELGADMNLRNVPPVRSVDPVDAKDLEEFMEAELRRKEEGGSEPEDSIFDLRNIPPKPGPSRIQSHSTHRQKPQKQKTPGAASTTVKSSSTQRVPNVSFSATRSQAGADTDSADELDNWDLGEASMVYRVAREEEEEEEAEVISSDSEVEFVEGPFIRSSIHSSRPEPPPKLSISTKQPPRAPVQQLQTPPRSHASTNIPSSPFEEFVELPPQSSSPVWLSSPLPENEDDDEDSLSPSPKPSPKQPQKRAQALQVSSDIPRIDLRKKSGKFPTTRKRVSPSPSPEPTPTKTPARTGSIIPTREKIVSPSKPKSQVEVLITTKPPMGSSKKVVPPEPTGKLLAKTAKGKQAVEESEVEDSEDERRESTASRNRSQSPLKRTTSQGKSKGVKTPELQHSAETKKSKAESPRDTTEKKSSGKSTKYGDLPTKAATGTKRKRVASAAEETPAEPLAGHSGEPSRAAKTPSSEEGVSEPGETTSRVKNTKASSSKSKPKSKAKAKSQTRRRSPTPELSSDDDSPQRSSRAPSQHPQYYPYPQLPYPTQPGVSQQHPYPFPDPRAQFIISQAMHQLTALVGGWPPPGAPNDGSGRASTPFVPPPYPYPNSYFSTPTHQSHPYPYAYDPNFSRATAPPDSPETPSGSGSGSKRKSLVQRSRSRGRHVSFQGSQSDENTEEPTSSAPPTPEPSAKTRPKGKARAQSGSEDRTGSNEKTRKQGKKPMPVSESDSDSEEEQVLHSRGRKTGRGQTPGPPSRTDSSDSGGVVQTKPRASSKRPVQKTR